MTDILNTSTPIEHSKQKKHLLCNLEFGGVVTLLMVGVAAYTQSVPIMVFAGLFVLAELENTYDYVCFCNKKQKN